MRFRERAGPETRNKSRICTMEQGARDVRDGRSLCLAGALVAFGITAAGCALQPGVPMWTERSGENDWTRPDTSTEQRQADFRECSEANLAYTDQRGWFRLEDGFRRCMVQRGYALTSP